MTIISANLQAVIARISAAARQAGRTQDSIQLVAVSKSVTVSAVLDAFKAGQRAFGENYIQEAEAKIASLGKLGLEWHFIGPLQSNKTRLVAQHFDWVHSIDRLKVAERLSQSRDPARGPMQVCVQVNVSGEVSKSGIAPDEAAPLARAVARLPNLRLRGLMAIPEASDDSRLARRRFAALRELRDKLNTEGLQLDTLSMGMSHDLEAAILEEATIVRVGTAIFGERGMLSLSAAP